MNAQLNLALDRNPLLDMPETERLRIAYFKCPCLWRRYGFARAAADPLIRKLLALTADALTRKEDRHAAYRN